nr:MAG TPA: N terminal extension of bacteriophage endosialidase [Caudoviricetes sp.]
MVSKVIEVMQQYIENSSISYADPIQWDITKQYPCNTVVVTVNGDGYLSTQPVPIGIDIDNEDYWTKIGNFSELWGSVKLAITPVDEKLKTTASANRNINDLVWLNNDLYVITKAMDAGTRYIEGTNCKKTDIGEQLNDLNTKVDNNKSSVDDSIKKINTNIENINTNLNKKIDKDTVGNLDQTVSGNMNQTVSGDYTIEANKFAVKSTKGFYNALVVSNEPNTPVTIGSQGGTFLDGPVKTSMIAQHYNDNFDWLPLTDSRGNDHKVALIRDTADFSTIPSSPVDIRAYQDLKMDGTDDITATINTHTKNEPLFIPAGTYKISAPLQLKHSLYGAGSSRDPARGTSDTILQYTASPTAFGSQGVITVSGDDVTGNIVIANLDIACSGMIGGIVFTTNKYTDNSIYNVSINKVKSYGVYLQPANSTLNRYCYMDNVMVWGFSNNTPVERWTGSVAFFWGNKAPDCECNNLVNMVCQIGFDCRTNIYGCNWTSYTGIPSGGTGGTDANSWWNNSIACKVTNNDIHVTNFYADTCKYAFVFDGPGKAAAYINNLIYACNDETATTATGYACIALIGTSPNPQFIVNGGIINRSAKVSTTVQSIGTYPVTNAVCSLDNVYIYTKREYIFGADAVKRGQYICASGEHRCIDLAITNQTQYTVDGQSVTGDPEQYKAFAFIPIPSVDCTSQGSIRVMDRNNIDFTVYLSNSPKSGELFAISAVDNRQLNNTIYKAPIGAGRTVTWDVVDDLNNLYYVNDSNAIILYFKRPASYSVTVQVSGFMDGNSPVILDRIRNEDGTPMDYPRWNNNNGMTAIKVLRPNIT